VPKYEFMCESCAKCFAGYAVTIAERANAKVQCPSCGGEKVTPQPTVIIAKTSRKS
jgi:putative FmdB family regulatory protein